MEIVNAIIPKSPNRRPGTKMVPTTITIHSTGNPSSTARNERGWLVNPSNTRTASWHIAVDEKEAVMAIPLDEVAWHAGNKVGNESSIGIEICESGNRQKTLENAAKLVAYLLKQRGWGTDKLRRHYDWSRKNCPRIFNNNGNWSAWEKFKSDVDTILKGNESKKEIYTKYVVDGVCTATRLNVRTQPINGKILGQIKKGERVKIIGKRNSNGWLHVLFYQGTGWVSPLWVDILDEKQIEGGNSKFYEVAGLQVIETTPENIYIAPMRGKTLRQLGVYGVNGTFFDTHNPAPVESTWCIAVNGGKALSENAKINGWKQPARGTMYFDGKVIGIKAVQSVNELPKDVIWAIGGGSLIPNYNPKEENWDSTVTYTTNRTGIAYKDNTVYLIVAKNMSMEEFRNRITNQLKVDGAIFLDGGGSTQMFYENNKGIRSTRGLNNLVGIRRI